VHGSFLKFICIFISSILLICGFWNPPTDLKAINTHTHTFCPPPLNTPHSVSMRGGPNGNYIPQTKTGEFHRHESRARFRYHRLIQQMREGRREREGEGERGKQERKRGANTDRYSKSIHLLAC